MPDDLKGRAAIVGVALALAAAAACGPDRTGRVERRPSAQTAAASSETMHQTSLRPADCRPAAPGLAAPYQARGLGVQQCSAPDGWQLFVVASDASSWIDVTGPGIAWSGERDVVYESPIGNFPNVDESTPAEWRGPATGQPRALVFRIAAQDRETLISTRTALYVVRLQSDTACVVGREATREAALRAADGNAACP